MASQELIAPNQHSAIAAQSDHFALMQRKAQLFANSPLIPDALRAGGPQQALANCYIGLTMAEAMGENPLTVLQNIHIVKGKAGFSAQFMIARANASPVFKGRINWRMSGQGDTLCAEAFATLAETGEEVSFPVDMTMAKAEGWTSNPKYRSVPHLMLRYRSATFLVRLYAPDVMFGYQTAEELQDVSYAQGGDVIEVKGGALTASMLLEQAAPVAEEVEVTNADGIEPAHEPEGRSDEQHGDQFPDDDEEKPAWWPLVEGLKVNLADAETLAAIKALDAEFVKIAAGLPDDVSEDVKAAISAARSRVRG